MQVTNLLRKARENNPDASRGSAQHGIAHVTWDRVDRIYIVGTLAREIVRGSRTRVFPVVAGLLSGSITS